MVHFGGVHSVLVLEVIRNVKQRPVMCIASIASSGVWVQNSYGRVFVYRGLKFNAPVAGVSPDPTFPSNTTDNNWESALGQNFTGLDVIADAIISGDQMNVILDFSKWPDDLCMSQEGQALGACVMQPIDGTTGGFLANANAVLTFIGQDVPDPDEADVRKLKAK